MWTGLDEGRVPEQCRRRNGLATMKARPVWVLSRVVQPNRPCVVPTYGTRSSAAGTPTDRAENSRSFSRMFTQIYQSPG